MNTTREARQRLADRLFLAKIKSLDVLGLERMLQRLARQGHLYSWKTVAVNRALVKRARERT